MLTGQGYLAAQLAKLYESSPSELGVGLMMGTARCCEDEDDKELKQLGSQGG